jgi:hypothetical protein
MYLEEPMKSVHNHYADAFMYAMEGVGHIEAGKNTNNALEMHKKAVENRKKLI